MSEDINRISGNGMEETPLNCMNGLRCDKDYVSLLKENNYTHTQNSESAGIPGRHCDISSIHESFIKANKHRYDVAMDDILSSIDSDYKLRSSFEEAVKGSTPEKFTSSTNNHDGMIDKRSNYDKGMSPMYNETMEHIHTKGGYNNLINNCSFSHNDHTSKQKRIISHDSKIPLPDRNQTTKSLRYSNVIDKPLNFIDKTHVIYKGNLQSVLHNSGECHDNQKYKQMFIETNKVEKQKLVDTNGRRNEVKKQRLVDTNIQHNKVIEQELVGNNNETYKVDKIFSSKESIKSVMVSPSRCESNRSVNEKVDKDSENEINCLNNQTPIIKQDMPRYRMSSPSSTIQMDVEPRQTKLSIIRKAIASSNAAVYDNIRPETEKDKRKRLAKLKKDISLGNIIEKKESLMNSINDKKNKLTSSTSRNTIAKDNHKIKSSSKHNKNPHPKLEVNKIQNFTINETTEDKLNIKIDCSSEDVASYDSTSKKTYPTENGCGEYVRDAECFNKKNSVVSNTEVDLKIIRKDKRLDEEDDWVQGYMYGGNYEFTELENVHKSCSDKSESSDITKSTSVETRMKNDIKNRKIKSSRHPVNDNDIFGNVFNVKRSHLTKFNLRDSREYIESSNYLPKDYITSSIEFESDNLERVSINSSRIPFSNGTPLFNTKKKNIDNKCDLLKRDLVNLKRESFTSIENDIIISRSINRTLITKETKEDINTVKKQTFITNALPSYEEAIKHRKRMVPLQLPPSYNYIKYVKSRPKLQKTPNLQIDTYKNTRSIGIQVMLIGKSLENENSERLMNIAKELNNKIQKCKIVESII